MMPFMLVLGPDLLAARLPVALCSIATVLATTLLGARLFSWRAGLAAGFVVLTSFGVFQYGRVGMMDLPLTLLMLLVAWGAWRYSEGCTPAVYVAGASMGAATMLKGPVGALIPMLALLGWIGVSWMARHSCERRWPVLPPKAGRHVALAAGLAVLLAATWPLALWMRGLGPTWFQHFIVGENLGKFDGPGTSIGYMLKGFLVLLAPWTLLLVGAIAVSCRRTLLVRPAVLLLVAFAAAPLVVYSLPRVKWAQYLLPSLPFLALLLGRAWEEALAAAPQVTPQGRLLRLLAAVTSAVLLVAAGWLALGVHLFASTGDRACLGVVALGLGVAGVALLHGPRMPLAGACLGVVLAAAALLAPSLTMQKVPDDLRAISQGRDMATYDVPPYFLMVQLRRAVGSVNTPQGFREAFERGDLLVVGQTEMQELVAKRALDMRRARLLTCWRKWRRHLRVQEIAQTILGGHLDDLTESVCVLERTKAAPPPEP